ncbi:MAG: flagellar biosynthetic protein FliO [Pseudomonadota bacterium]|nr:flagellar biosynthetic protein FliO [Pseudomonadota bacterium]
MQHGLMSLVWFVIVLGAIPLALWLLKRSGYAGAAGASAAQAGVPRTVATLALSPQQRLMTVEVGQGEHRTWLVLGVSPQGIRTLHTLPAGVLTPLAVDTTAAGTVPGFAGLLSRFRKPGDHAQV